MSHYFDVRLARQFDLLLHVDETHAVVLLDAPDHWPQPHEAETYRRGCSGASARGGRARARDRGRRGVYSPRRACRCGLRPQESARCLTVSPRGWPGR